MEKENPSYFAVIPANVRYDADLIPSAKLLYGELTCLSTKEGYCFASNNYFAKLYNVTPQAVSRWIKSLENKGYISTKLIYDGKQVIERRIYIANVSIKIDTLSINSLEGINKKLGGYQLKVKDNNTSNNNININNEGATAPAPKKTVKKFVPPTREEIVAYCQSKGYNIDVDHFISTYSPDGGTWRYKDGSPVKDWKRCCVTWAYNGKKYDAQRSAGRGNLYGNENDCAQVYAGIL